MTEGYAACGAVKETTAVVNAVPAAAVMAMPPVVT